MNYYHINKDNLTIISGPHIPNSTYIKKLTRCGNPELLDLILYDLVPQSRPPLSENQRYTSSTNVQPNYVEMGVEVIPIEEQLETQKQSLIGVVQLHLDQMARNRGYDGILSLCSYATSTDVIFSAEGQAGVEWRDSVWRTCYTILSDVQGGTRSIPTDEELILELPVIQW